MANTADNLNLSEVDLGYIHSVHQGVPWAQYTHRARFRRTQALQCQICNLELQQA